LLPFVLRRLLLLVPTLFGISLVTFLLLRLVPGDAAELSTQDADGGVRADVDAGALIAGFRERHLLDQPLWRQYLHYVGPFSLAPDGHPWFGGAGEDPWSGILAGDLGAEFLRPQVDVADEIVRRLGVTLPMTGLAILLAYLVSIPLGILSAVRRGSVLDKASTALVFALYALPAFWLGLLLQMAFGRTGLGLLPTIGLASPDAAELSGPARLGDALAHLVLPVACYTLGSLAYLSRQMRAGLVEVVASDYIRTARAKGLPERVVIGKHALRNALLPLVTLFASVLPALVGGSIVVETIFDLPGMGSYVFESMMRREYNAILGTVLFGAVTTVGGLILSDVLYAVCDPRIRVAGRAARG
jgi:peptide/nickel transport system permease protein